MNAYDQARELARTLRESDEYREYARLRDVAYSDETNKTLLDEYKRLQFQMQAKLASGGSMDPDELERMQKIAGLLQFNPDASQFLLAEFRFQRMLADIYKILAEVADINLDFLTGR